MTHAFYVDAAWGACAVVIVAITFGAWWQSRRLQAELKRLEAQGVRRRSQARTDAA